MLCVARDDCESAQAFGYGQTRSNIFYTQIGLSLPWLRSTPGHPDPANCAINLRDEGMNSTKALREEASLARLFRANLMTGRTTGCRIRFLILSEGAGAETRQSALVWVDIVPASSPLAFITVLSFDSLCAVRAQVRLPGAMWRASLNRNRTRQTWLERCGIALSVSASASLSAGRVNRKPSCWHMLRL